MNFDYIVETKKWADGFTEVKTTKMTKKLAECEWGMLWMITGGCGFGIIIPFILGLVFMSEEIFGLSVAIMLFIPILPLQILHHTAEEKIFYNEEIKNRKQMNLFRDFDLK